MNFIFPYVYTYIYIYILGIIIPIDFHIFQRGRSTTNQIGLWGSHGITNKINVMIRARFPLGLRVQMDMVGRSWERCVVDLHKRPSFLSVLWKNWVTLW